MKKHMLVLLAVMIVFTLSGISTATAASVSAKDPYEIVNIARGYGSATLGTDNVGDPKITGRIDGVKYSIYFMGCSNNTNCDSIQFSAGWSMSAAKRPSLNTINTWNAKKRFGKAYLDSDGDPRIEIDLPLSEVSVSYLERYFGWWQVALRYFKEYINE